MFFKGSKIIKFIQDETMGDINEDWKQEQMEKEEDNSLSFQTDESMKDLDLISEKPESSKVKENLGRKISNKILDQFKNQENKSLIGKSLSPEKQQ